MKTILSLFLLLNIIVIPQSDISKISPSLLEQVSLNSGTSEIRCWIFFTDKGDNTENYVLNPLSVVSDKSLLRRTKLNKKTSLLEFSDFPVNQDYISLIEKEGFRVKHKSKWFNAVSGTIESNKLTNLSKLGFISKIDIVYSMKKSNPYIELSENPNSADVNRNLNFEKNLYSFDYGNSLSQLQQVNVPSVHNMNVTGQGVNIAVLDAGFNNLQHEAFANMNIIAKWDFVNNDPNVGDSTDMGYGGHGTNTLSVIGGFKQGSLIGPAFSANFILAKTENTESETPIEEDNWIAAIEWADSIGVDVTSTSLGYIGFDAPYPSYTWQSMDGNTCRITIAADLAAAKGIVVVNSAGNEGFHETHNTLGAPSDGDSVIAVGSVDFLGQRSSFSSVGNTVDGRIKPDIMTMGERTLVASAYTSNGYYLANGTSFSCPIAAGIAGLILSYNPSLSPMQVREALLHSSDRFNNPDREYGYGIPNALNAVTYFPLSGNSIAADLTFELLQNYPNPFNPSTTITFNLNKRDRVSLKIYDIVGNEIATLIDSEREAGRYKIEYIPEKHISSGVYFYRITFGNQSLTRSMVFLK